MIVDYCRKELVRTEIEDFTRLSASEGLVSILKDVDVSSILFEAKTQSASVEKQLERLERSVFVHTTQFKNVKLD